jgi:hypothetical protein
VWIKRGRYSVIRLLCGVSAILLAGGCCSTARQDGQRSGPPAPWVAVVSGNNIVSPRTLHLSKGKHDRAIWVASESVAAGVSFTLTPAQLDPFLGMTCKQLDSQTRVCEIICSETGTCRSGEINPALDIPHGGTVSFNYNATFGSQAKADPVIIIHE